MVHSGQRGMDGVDSVAWPQGPGHQGIGADRAAMASGPAASPTILIRAPQRPYSVFLFGPGRDGLRGRFVTARTSWNHLRTHTFEYPVILAKVS